MRTNRYWKQARQSAAGVLVLALAVAASAADDDTTTKPAKEPPDPPGTSLYMSQLRPLFLRWDLNKDSFLDKKELAVAFRGKAARPFDFKAGKPGNEKPKTQESPGTTTQPKPAGKPDYSAYPDYQFLTQLDQDGDEQISRTEFMAWARDYAVQLKHQDDTLKQVAKLQGQLAKAKPGSKQQQSLQAQAQKQQAALARLQKEAKAFEKAMQRALKN